MIGAMKDPDAKLQMSVKRAEDVAQENVSVGTGTTRQVLIGPGEGPHFAMRRFIMQPGGGIPVHTNTVEHEQYVLRGRAAMTIGDEPVEVKAGDVVFIPAGTPHPIRCWAPSRSSSCAWCRTCRTGWRSWSARRSRSPRAVVLGALGRFRLSARRLPASIRARSWGRSSALAATQAPTSANRIVMASLPGESPHIFT